MTHHLYRFYLYIVFIALLIYITVAIEMLLNTLFLLTPLRQTYEAAPTGAVVLQSVTFGIVSLVIAGALAGLHYWLIRRDIRADPEAGSSAIRALFLNLTEAMSIAIAVPVFGYGFLSQLGTSSGSGNTYTLAITIPTLLLAGILELERRRTQADTGIAITFQRLHFYGVQLLFLGFFAEICFYTSTQLLDGLFFRGAGQIAKEICGQNGGTCTNYQPIFLLLNLLWFLAFWVLYGWTTRNDKSEILRLIAEYIGLATGFAFLIDAIFQGGQILLLSAFHFALPIGDIFGPYANNNFLGPLVFSLIAIPIGHYWLVRATRIDLIKPKALHLIEITFLAILTGGTFWWGCGTGLYHLMDIFFSKVAFDGHDWAVIGSQIIAGIGYIPLDFFLWRRNKEGVEEAASPRRGLVLAFLGGGILAFAIGGAAALYAWITNVFGSPIANWEQAAHIGLAAFLVGVMLIGVYLQAARREHLFAGATKSVPEPEVLTPDQTTEQPMTVEHILDELLAGKITKDEAAKQIHQITADPKKESQTIADKPTQELVDPKKENQMVADEPTQKLVEEKPVHG